MYQHHLIQLKELRELKTNEEKVQKMTDKFIKEVDKAIDAKSSEILTI